MTIPSAEALGKAALLKGLWARLVLWSEVLTSRVLLELLAIRCPQLLPSAFLGQPICSPSGIFTQGAAPPPPPPCSYGREKMLSVSEQAAISGRLVDLSCLPWSPPGARRPDLLGLA